MIHDQATRTPETGNPGLPAAAVAGVSLVRRHRALILISLLIAAALVLAVTTRLAPERDTRALSVENASPEGGMAAAKILGRHGVNVEQTDSLDSTLGALNKPGDGSDEGDRTVLLYDPNGFLGESQLQELAESADRLVVVTPHFRTLQALDDRIRPAGVVPTAVNTLDPGCGVPDANAAGAVSAESAYLYTGGNVCYRLDGEGGGLYASSVDGWLVVLGSAGIISNDLLDEQGNSALVLRTLGAGSRLVWYLPGIQDILASESPLTLNDLAPDWVKFLGPWLVLVALLSMFWRGRRLGPLVREPLPVIVKAVETAEGRARLYHDARAVGHAAESLRAGTMVRLARSLRLGSDVEADGVIEATSRYLGKPREQIAELLNARPRTEAQLVHWAQNLERLEKEVTPR